ncbi:hypothetical protein GNVKYODX_CDS70 [Acinetobacter phage vB_AbaM_AB3P2]|nr:hypothetical protein GNVKYODX_CDS70 [Acinetobacter phage vB_AbaM_AB3P2]
MKTHSNNTHHLGVEISHLIKLISGKRHKMPNGLTRSQRREWAKKVACENNP